MDGRVVVVNNGEPSLDDRGVVRAVLEDVSLDNRFRHSEIEPPLGLEPRTPALRKLCSTD